jgi:hypothetical protein
MENTSPIDLTQLPPQSSERKDQATKRLCGVFLPDWDFGRQVADFKASYD